MRRFFSLRAFRSERRKPLYRGPQPPPFTPATILRKRRDRASEPSMPRPSGAQVSSPTDAGQRPIAGAGPNATMTHPRPANPATRLDSSAFSPLP
jgi:hypothetical protein